MALPYTQIIPIYFASDEAVGSHFRDHRDEINEISRQIVFILEEGNLGARKAGDVASAIDSRRFPGLTAANVPCLWVESGQTHFKVPLPDQREGVARTVRQVVSALVNAESFADGERRWLAGQSSGSTPHVSIPAVPLTGARPTIISLHGFNTRADWQREIQVACNKAGVDHVPWTYGFVGIPKFLSPWDRNAKIEWFRNEYERFQMRQQPGTPLPSLIAHSYGSYIAAMAMMRYPEQIRFNRIVLCGSIIPKDFDWDTAVTNRQVVEVLNDFGRKDVWPRVAELVIRDAGSSGYEGFEHDAGGKVIQRSNALWGHSSYFSGLNFQDRWLPFLANGLAPQEAKPYRGRRFNRRFAVVAATLTLLLAGAVWIAAR